MASTRAKLVNSPTPPSKTASGIQNLEVNGSAPIASRASTCLNSVVTAARSTPRNCSEGVPGAFLIAFVTAVTPNCSCVTVKFRKCPSDVCPCDLPVTAAPAAPGPARAVTPPAAASAPARPSIRRRVVPSAAVWPWISTMVPPGIG
jgi:hypothetical protein